MKIISVSFQSIPGDVTDVLMSKGYVENEFDNINIVKVKLLAIFFSFGVQSEKCSVFLKPFHPGRRSVWGQKNWRCP